MLNGLSGIKSLVGVSWAFRFSDVDLIKNTVAYVRILYCGRIAVLIEIRLNI